MRAGLFNKIALSSDRCKNSFPKSVRHIAGYNAVFRVVGNYLYKGKKTKNEKSRYFCFKRYNFTCGIIQQNPSHNCFGAQVEA